MDAVYVLGPAGHLGLDVRLCQLLLQGPDHPLDVLFPHLSLGAQELGYLPVDIGLDVLEGQILQPPLNFPDAKPVSERGVDVQGLLSDGDPALEPEGLERAHVMEAVGQLDEHHPHVLRHGDEHLSYAGGPGRAISGAGLLRCVPLRHRFRLSQLGHAVYQLGHLRSEAALKLRGRYPAVLNDIVQYGG